MKINIKEYDISSIDDTFHIYEVDRSVLRFINTFVNKQSEYNKDSADIITNQFMNGYCYYFAEMLKVAFNRGKICWVAPHGHMVWMDINGVPYDICGINKDTCEEYIPISYIPKALSDFKHVGKYFDASEEYIDNAIKRYREDKEKEKYVTTDNCNYNIMENRK